MNQVQLEGLANANRLLALDYPVKPRCRARLEDTPQGPLADRIAADQATTAQLSSNFSPCCRASRKFRRRAPTRVSPIG